jgi:hypothetical protein
MLYLGDLNALLDHRINKGDGSIVRDLIQVVLADTKHRSRQKLRREQFASIADEVRVD